MLVTGKNWSIVGMLVTGKLECWWNVSDRQTGVLVKC